MMNVCRLVDYARGAIRKEVILADSRRPYTDADAFLCKRLKNDLG